MVSGKAIVRISFPCASRRTITGNSAVTEECGDDPFDGNAVLEVERMDDGENYEESSQFVKEDDKLTVVENELVGRFGEPADGKRRGTRIDLGIATKI